MIPACLPLGSFTGSVTRGISSRSVLRHGVIMPDASDGRRSFRRNMMRQDAMTPECPRLPRISRALGGCARGIISFSRVLLFTFWSASTWAQDGSHLECDTGLQCVIGARNLLRCNDGLTYDGGGALIGSQSMLMNRGSPFSDTPNRTGPFSDTPNRAGPFSDTPNRIGPFSDVPNRIGPFSDAPNRAGPFSDTPNRVGPFSDVPNRVGPFSDVPNRAGPFSDTPNRTGPFSNTPNRTGPFSDIPEAQVHRGPPLRCDKGRPCALDTSGVVRCN